MPLHCFLYISKTPTLKAIGFSRNMSVFNNIFVVLILFFLDNVNSYGSYRDRIPNGYAVRHPCNGSPWGGVGHIRQGGGGARNKFGLDYARYRDWRQICQLDSDGDGRTNGEELGDPQCVWTGGPAPVTTAPITHPGVCDNIGGGICPGLTMDGCQAQPPQMQQPNQFMPPNAPSQFMPPNQPPVMQPNPNPMPGGQTWGGSQTRPMPMPNQMPPQTQFGGVNPAMQQPPMQPMPNQQNFPFNGGNGFQNNQNFQTQPQQGFPNQVVPNQVPQPGSLCGDLSSPDTKPFNIRLPTLQVPATQDVTYACVVVDAPLDTSYHVIASSPVIDNVAVVHSMNVYGCKRGTETTAVPISNSPFKCSLEPIDGCNEFITGYSPSYQDVCFHRGTGVRLGRMGYRKVMLQVLWSNPSRIAGGTDSSGMNLYITTRLRQNNVGVATLKVAQFSLPPWQPSYEIKAACSPECSTVQIKKPIYITGGINYMHMLGRDQKIEVLRNGNIVALVTKDQNVNYPHPRLFTLRKAVEVQPGDEIRVTCAYNTYSVNRTVVSGSGPTDEVCSAEVSYYPSENWNNPECENFLSLPLCKIKAVGVINGCQFSRFLSSLPKEPTVDAIITECNQNCNQNCSNLVEIIKRHSCFQGDLLNLWESNLNALKNNRLNIVFWAIRNCENISRNTMPIIPGPGPV